MAFSSQLVHVCYLLLSSAAAADDDAVAVAADVDGAVVAAAVGSGCVIQISIVRCWVRSHFHQAAGRWKALTAPARQCAIIIKCQHSCVYVMRAQKERHAADLHSINR